MNTIEERMSQHVLTGGPLAQGPQQCVVGGWGDVCGPSSLFSVLPSFLSPFIPCFLGFSLTLARPGAPYPHFLVAVGRQMALGMTDTRGLLLQ